MLPRSSPARTCSVSFGSSSPRSLLPNQPIHTVPSPQAATSLRPTLKNCRNTPLGLSNSLLTLHCSFRMESPIPLSLPLIPLLSLLREASYLLSKNRARPIFSQHSKHSRRYPSPPSPPPIFPLSLLSLKVHTPVRTSKAPFLSPLIEIHDDERLLGFFTSFFGWCPDRASGDAESPSPIPTPN